MRCEANCRVLLLVGGAVDSSLLRVDQTRSPWRCPSLVVAGCVLLSGSLGVLPWPTAEGGGGADDNVGYGVEWPVGSLLQWGVEMCRDYERMGRCHAGLVQSGVALSSAGGGLDCGGTFSRPSHQKLARQRNGQPQQLETEICTREPRAAGAQLQRAATEAGACRSDTTAVADAHQACGGRCLYIAAATARLDDATACHVGHTPTRPCPPSAILRYPHQSLPTTITATLHRLNMLHALCCGQHLLHPLLGQAHTYCCVAPSPAAAPTSAATWSACPPPSCPPLPEPTMLQVRTSP